jgi:hypothetical protein
MDGMAEFKTQSESIGKIAAALTAFQASTKGVKKTAENPYFHSKYAELSDVWDEIREPLTKNGLSVVQTFLGDSLVTTLAHTSGEWFRGYLRLTPVKANDPQAQGSAITYVRRYALQAITGIAPIDDDGNAAAHASRTPTEATGETFGARAGESATRPAPKPKGDMKLHTSRFELSEPQTSKKSGKVFRKAMDSEGASFFIWADDVAADLQVANGAEVTVEYEAGQFPTIRRVVNE